MPGSRERRVPGLCRANIGSQRLGPQLVGEIVRSPGQQPAFVMPHWRALEGARATDMGTPDRAEAWVRMALGRGERIMGFGHRVYKIRDPRAEILSDAAETIARQTGDCRLLDFIREVERVTVKILEAVKPWRDLYANVELYAALMLHTVDIPAEIFTPTFAVGRTAGWTAHVLEQFADHRLIRPQFGIRRPRDRAFVPIERR